MSILAVQQIIGQALVSQSFSQQLLNSRRAVLLSQYDLLPQERQFLLSIQAETLQEFVQAVEGQMGEQTNGQIANRTKNHERN